MKILTTEAVHQMIALSERAHATHLTFRYKEPGFSCKLPDLDEVEQMWRAREEAERPLRQELGALIEALSDDEKKALLALFWLGLCKYTLFAHARDASEEARLDNLGSKLADDPHLSDCLNLGLQRVCNLE